MCFELDSEPPIPVIRGAAVAHEDIVLTAADGTDLAAFLAVPESRPGTASSCSPTSAASTTSTRSSRSGSPSAA